jgi:transcriptional regulator with XRE-family HTH domain
LTWRALVAINCAWICANVENFARLRQKKGLTQEQVAAQSGFSEQYISGLERGKRNPTIITLYELAVAIDVGHIELSDETSPSKTNRQAGQQAIVPSLQMHYDHDQPLIS